MKMKKNRLQIKRNKDVDLRNDNYQISTIYSLLCIYHLFVLFFIHKERWTFCCPVFDKSYHFYVCFYVWLFYCCRMIFKTHLKVILVGSKASSIVLVILYLSFFFISFESSICGLALINFHKYTYTRRYRYIQIDNNKFSIINN